jgi:hypothetical protein
MIKTIIGISLLLQCFLLQAQLNNKHWIVGYSPSVQFTFTDTSVTNAPYFIQQPFRFADGYSNISEKNSMPITCNGYFLFNEEGQLIENGDYLVPHKLVDAQSTSSSYNQTSILLPKKSNQYYVFVGSMSDLQYDNCVAGQICKFDILTYSIVDMNLNDGKGKVIEKGNYLLKDDSIRSTLTVVRHANGRDWWLIAYHYLRHSYYKFIVSEESIQGPFIQDLGSPLIPFHRLAQTSFSQDGTLFAASQNNEPDIILDKFDRCSGQFTTFQVLHPPKDSFTQEYAGMGNCFSPDNRFLYLTSGYGVYQYEIGTGEYVSLMTDSINYKGNTFMKYADDGRIYIGNFDKTDSLMSFIRYPNEKGKDCELCVLCYATRNVNASAPPNMPNYDLGPLKNSPCDTIGKLHSNEVVVYPNPANSFLHVYVPKLMNSTVQLALYNLLGQRVAVWEEVLNSKQEVQVSLPRLATGLYTLDIVCDGEKYVRKLVVE